ncbi:MAG: Jag N-terminal domain-containing protein [Proteobacteria bacterium]|nr:Jag N-terminal domain-containing protein [Pseudomonadota bacterium]
MSPQTNSSPSAKAPVTIEGKSLEQALVKAAGSLGCTQDEIEYRVTKEETARGLFSFFKNQVVVIEAWPKARAQTERPRRERRERDRDREPRTTRPRSSERNRDEDQADAVKAEPLSAEQVDALKEELRLFCAGICAHIAGEPVDVEASIDDGRLVLNIDHPFISEQIHKNSKLAEALEHILRKKPRHLRQELPFRIFADVSGVRRKREDDLIQMAFDLSAQVHENKRPIVLNYKSSYDRKIIHMALDRDDRVYTKSIGSGPNRKLMILPSKDGQDLPPTVVEGD